MKIGYLQVIPSQSNGIIVTNSNLIIDKIQLGSAFSGNPNSYSFSLFYYNSYSSESGNQFLVSNLLDIGIISTTSTISFSSSSNIVYIGSSLTVMISISTGKIYYFFKFYFK